MALLFMDSANGNDQTTKWDSFTGGFSSPTPTGGSYYTLGGTNLIRKFVPDTPDVTVGCLGRLTSLDIDNSNLTAPFTPRTDNGVSGHWTFTTTPDGAIHVRRAAGPSGTAGNGTLLASSVAGVITINAWHFWEIRSKIDNAAGRIEIWIDGVKRIDFTGDTDAGATDPNIDEVRFSRVSLGAWHVADVYITDNTIPFGPCRPILLRPSGNGNSSMLVGQDANSVDNYLNVDEAVPDSDTTYNASSTEGDKDTYVLDDLPTGTYTILAVQSMLFARKDDSGVKFIRPVLRTGGADFVGASHALATSYQTFLDIWEDNPDTATDWLQAEIDALEAGAEVRDS
jgi:hypothetical protein